MQLLIIFNDQDLFLKAVHDYSHWEKSQWLFIVQGIICILGQATDLSSSISLHQIYRTWTKRWDWLVMCVILFFPSSLTASSANTWDYGHLINCKVAEMCWRGWQTWQGASGSCTYSPLPVCPFTQGSNISISKTLQITQLSFLADRAYCSLIFNLPPTQTHRSLSVELLSSLLSPNFDVKPGFPQPRCRIQHSGGTCFLSKLLKESITG